MLSGQMQSVTDLTAHPSSDENICILTNSSDLLDQLVKLQTSKRKFDLLLIDSAKSGFLFPVETFFESANIAKQLLEIEGCLIFLTHDRAIALTKDSVLGNLSLHNFSSYSELFDHWPSLVMHVQSTISKAEIKPENTDLTQQVLMSSVPVLRDAGIKAKGTRQVLDKTSVVLSFVDSFTPISAICARLIETQKLTTEQVLQEIKALEFQKFIYPIFPKIPFLVNCFRNRSPFTLRDYLLASHLVTQSQFDELMVNASYRPGKDTTYIGGQLLKMHYINARQLEVVMRDLAFRTKGRFRPQ